MNKLFLITFLLLLPILNGCGGGNPNNSESEYSQYEKSDKDEYSMKAISSASEVRSLLANRTFSDENSNYIDFQGREPMTVSFNGMNIAQNIRVDDYGIDSGIPYAQIVILGTNGVNTTMFLNIIRDKMYLTDVNDQSTYISER